MINAEKNFNQVIPSFEEKMNRMVKLLRAVQKLENPSVFFGFYFDFFNITSFD